MANRGGKNGLNGQGEDTSFSPAGQSPCLSCPDCAFYEEIALANGHKRKVCHLSGEKNPAFGGIGCSFLAGKWENLNTQG